MDPAFKDRGGCYFAEAQRRMGISKEQGMAYFYNLRTGIMEDRYAKSDIIAAKRAFGNQRQGRRQTAKNRIHVW